MFLRKEEYPHFPPEVVEMSRNSGFGLHHVKFWRRSYPEHEGLSELARGFRREAQLREISNLERRLQDGGEVLRVGRERVRVPFSARAKERMNDKLERLLIITS